MADDDLFIDQERIKKMIAAGIYDEDMASKVMNVKNKDLKEASLLRTEVPPIRNIERQSPSNNPSFKPSSARGRGTDNRGQKAMNRGRAQNERMTRKRFGFEPVSNSSFNWSEPKNNTTDDFDDRTYNKRTRDLSPQRDGYRDGFRESIRDGIQTKIQRNELQRKLNEDFNTDRNSGKSSNDTDLRPALDTDSRIHDTDLRMASNLATNDDYRLGSGDVGSMRTGIARNPKEFANSLIEQRFASKQRSETSNVLKDPFMDDIDEFIKNASSKLNIMPTELKGAHNRSQSSQNRNEMFSRSDDPLGLKQPNESFNVRITPNDNFDSIPNIVEEPNETVQNPISILKETVEELAKSNLYCQYCDCYLSSLIEVNTHIGTANHQKNMTKKVMEETKSNAGANESVNRPISQTIVERVPTGMAAIVQMIEKKQQITLKSLTEMDNYEINCDSEAALAKELAKLLTNELLNYKMSLMPEDIKEALKHQGIGLLDSMVSN